jgi:hypothetical protein
VNAAVLAAVEANARQSFEQTIMEDIRARQIDAISMSTRVPGVLGGEPAFQPAYAMGPDEPSRNPIYFTARERIGVGVINPRGLTRLGLTSDGEEHPEIFPTEYLGTFRDTDSADRQAVAGQRVTMPEFSIEANPRVQLGDIQTRRFDLFERSKPLPYPVDTWLMADGLMVQVEVATQKHLKCRIWDPQRKRFVGDIEIVIAERLIKIIPAPPERTAWDWLLDD